MAMTEADKKIAVLETEIDTLKKKLKLANELNLKLFEDYKKASSDLKMIEEIMKQNLS